MILFISILVFIFLMVDLFTKQEKFGEHPKGKRLERISLSKNYKKNKFENKSHTPVMAENASYPKIMRDFFLKRNPRSKPKKEIPSIKINLKKLGPDENILVWFGHSSYFIQLDGRRFLIDPVFSGSASPLSFTTKSFKGSDIYTSEDMPEIDYLIITHDHWDHLDHKTVIQLKSKITKIVTSLGVGAHLERWGFSKDIIFEKNWDESFLPEDGFEIHCKTARHFSGRSFKRAQTVWSSFVLKTPNLNLYLGGDSGYDSHFKEIGDQYGPFDLAILECGQYNPNWKYIHMMPEETVQAGIDLGAKVLMPVHWGKFVLSLHDWDEPIQRVVKEAKIKNMALLTPHIGEAVNLKAIPQKMEAWWENLN